MHICRRFAQFFMPFILCFGFQIPLLAETQFPSDTKIKQIGDSLHHPWGMSFLDDTHLLVTERRGKLFLISVEDGKTEEITPIPEVFDKRQGGLLDVLTRPHSDVIYLCLSLPDGDGKARTSVLQAVLKGTSLTRQKFLFKSNLNSNSGHHFGCRLALDGTLLYASLGERGDRDTAQDETLQAGGLIAYDLAAGSLIAPARSTWAMGMQTKGNRNPQGMAKNPKTGEIWMHEHGPKGGDEINIFKKGANYGWPITSFGKEYYGGKVGEGISEAEGITSPIWHWTPSIAPSGMAFYKGDMFDFDGHLLVGSLKFRSLYLVHIDDNQPVSETVILKNSVGRIRDVEVAQDGSIYVLSDETNGGLYQIYRP